MSALNGISLRASALRSVVLLGALLAAAIILLPSEPSRADDRSFKSYRNNEVAQARPKRPVKIKFKRNAKGAYSWEIEGESADEIAEADRRLREYIEQAGLKRNK
jgi:hypothetical protein